MTTIRKVGFRSRGIDIVGDLYLPSDDSTDRKGAAIIVGHPGTGIKEQASGLYAHLLAEAGFTALAFDAANQGESGGDPRNLEDPYQRVEDFKCAVTYLSTLGNGVDPERIGLTGICASGGYGMFAAQTDVRIKAVAGVAPMCTGTMARVALQDEFGDISPQNLQMSLAPSGQDRIAEANGGQGMMINILDSGEAGEYYSTPLGYHPRCTNTQLARSFELLLNYDSIAYIKWIAPRPLLLIVGTEPMKTFDTIPFGKTAYADAHHPKELFVVEGLKHLDFYHETSESLPKLVKFFAEALCA